MFGWHAMRLKRRRGIYLVHLETIFWFKQGSKRRVWDPEITGGEMLKQHLEDKVSRSSRLQNSEAAKQRALLQATIEKNKVQADRQFAEMMNALKALQPPTTLPEDTTTMINTEKSGEDCGNMEEFMVASDVEEAAITTPIM
ncbi:hypothetical protein Tco_0081556, partial [Tanacetum coccineum]